MKTTVAVQILRAACDKIKIYMVNKKLQKALDIILKKLLILD